MGSVALILTASLVLWLAGFHFLARIWPGHQAAPQSHLPHPLSIIVPARNEEHNLTALLRSINAQSVRPLEVLVVDDASTDRTAEVARSLGATVLTSQPLPEGWRGKAWACQQGANSARGNVLLFVDADTWFEVDGLQRILNSYISGALSVGPHHAVRRPYEQLSIFFNLIMAVSTVPHGLFGQMLLVDRESYLRAGGHEAAKGRVLENFCLAKTFRHAGIPVRSRTGPGEISFRMYPHGLAEVIEGWTKGFSSGAQQTPKPLLLLIVAWLSGMMLPIGLLQSSPWAYMLYLLYAAQLGVMFRRIGSFRWYTALLYPLPLLFFFAIFSWSALRSGRKVVWKGRSIYAD